MENIDIDIDIDKDNLKNIDIDMAILENIDIDIDIDKGILQNIDIDKISYRLGFGISNTPIQMSHWSDWICLLSTISISLIAILYFLWCFKVNAPLAVALAITIIRHKSYVIDHTSQTIGHRR